MASNLELYLGFAFKTRGKPRPWRTNDPLMFQHDRDKTRSMFEVLRKALLSHPTRWDQRTLPHSAFGSPPKWSTRKFYSDKTRKNFFFRRTKSTQDHWRRHPRNRGHPLRFRAESILGYDIMCNGTIGPPPHNAVGWDARLGWRCCSRLLRISWLQLRLCSLAELLPRLAWSEASLALRRSTVSLSASFLHPVFQPCHCHFPSSSFLVERRGICVHPVLSVVAPAVHRVGPTCSGARSVRDVTHPHFTPLSSSSSSYFSHPFNRWLGAVSGFCFSSLSSSVASNLSLAPLVVCLLHVHCLFPCHLRSVGREELFACLLVF